MLYACIDLKVTYVSRQNEYSSLNRSCILDRVVEHHQHLCRTWVVGSVHGDLGVVHCVRDSEYLEQVTRDVVKTEGYVELRRKVRNKPKKLA